MEINILTNNGNKEKEHSNKSSYSDSWRLVDFFSLTEGRFLCLSNFGFSDPRPKNHRPVMMWLFWTCRIWLWHFPSGKYTRKTLIQNAFDLRLSVACSGTIFIATIIKNLTIVLVWNILCSSINFMFCSEWFHHLFHPVFLLDKRFFFTHSQV